MPKHAGGDGDDFTRRLRSREGQIASGVQTARHKRRLDSRHVPRSRFGQESGGVGINSDCECSQCPANLIADFTGLTPDPAVDLTDSCLDMASLVVLDCQLRSTHQCDNLHYEFDPKSCAYAGEMLISPPHWAAQPGCGGSGIGEMRGCGDDWRICYGLIICGTIGPRRARLVVIATGHIFAPFPTCSGFVVGRVIGNWRCDNFRCDRENVMTYYDVAYESGTCINTTGAFPYCSPCVPPSITVYPA